MTAVSTVKLALSGGVDAADVCLVLSLLPKSAGNPAPLIDCRNSGDDDSSIPAVQLLEGHEYRYEWQFKGNAPVSTDPEEIFQPDTADGHQGRLRPGLATGTLRVVLRNEAKVLGELELEVRSRKLTYRSEYRWMLRDIAEQMTELLMQRFAATSARFKADATRDAVTLYERFEFLRALLTSEAMELAFQQILRRPHIAWEERSELVLAGQPVRASAQTARSITRGGHRIAWPNGRTPFLPRQLEVEKTEATTDTPPNRFVRFALERWRQVVADIQFRLKESGTPAAKRARREVADTLEKLEQLLSAELLRGVGPLTHFPADNQVLHRRDGYREIFRSYLEFELAATLCWSRDEASYSAGQRDVAQLYEYWAFICLATLISDLVGSAFDIAPILDVKADGLSIGLRSGRQTVVSGTIERLGRRLKVDLCFNRTFAPGHGSWTVQMRPDYSLIIAEADDTGVAYDPVILHFDAKYRVNAIQELFGQSESSDVDAELLRREAKRADLLKMHAYRDAIHRSAGAYILFPGDDSPSNTQEFKEYRELLPGLGAFVLRPCISGEPAGSRTLKKFIGDVLDHVAARFSRHERGRYWLEETYHRYEPSKTSLFPLGAPLDSTTVLLGYVKSAEHWAWIQKCLTYNVRAEGRRGGVAENASLLYSQLLVLYGPSIDLVAVARIVSSPQLTSRAQMLSAEYPIPMSEYLCVHLSGLTRNVPINRVSAAAIERCAFSRTGQLGQPIDTTWGQLIAELESS